MVPESLRWHTKGAIELARGILPGDSRRQLDDLVVVEVLLHSAEELVVNVAVGEGDGVGVFEGGPIRVSVMGTVRVVLQVEDLPVGRSQFAADRSVEVISEDAAVEHRHPSIDQRRQDGIEMS